MTQKDEQMGRNIRRIRKQAGLTQEQLAEKAGLSTTYIGYIEIGSKRPALRSLEKIARALGVKVKDLIPY